MPCFHPYQPAVMAAAVAVRARIMPSMAGFGEGGDRGGLGDGVRGGNVLRVDGGPWADVDTRRATFARRRDALHAWLSERGIPHTVPGGAFYQPLPLPTGTDSFDAAMSLLDDGVAVVPGRAFVESAEPFLRMSFTADIPTLLKGLAIIERRFLK